MSSVLERPELNKIFLIYGNLDDMFLSPDLQKNNFRPFLCGYLRSIGYEQIVFYSGAKNTGKYVLDDRSAMLAINKNRRQAVSAGSQVPPASGSAPRKKRRIRNPNLGASENTEETNGAAADDAANAAAQAQISHDGAGEAKLVYQQSKITPAEFLDDAKKMMADGSVKTAIVFPFFQDFVTDSAAPQQQYTELLSHLWGEYTLSANDNICIFLAPQMNAEALTGLFDRLTAGNVFRSRFFNPNGTINRSCTIEVGLPGRDELGWMLEYLRLAGEEGQRLSFRRSDLPGMVSSLLFLSREADREDNRAGYLSAVYDNIVRYMKEQPGDVVPLDESAVRHIYRRYRTDNVADPMEKLMNTKGWEAVAQRVKEIVTDYRQKKERALRSSVPHGKNEKNGQIGQNKKNGGQPTHPTPFKKICASERLDAPDSGGFDYPIPHFVIRGNPGVGKTTVARLIGQIFYEAGILRRGMTIEATKEDLVDRYVGGTPARTRLKLLEAEESVLFVDDAYSLIDRSEDNNYSKEAIDEIVAAMTNPKQYRFCMIMAGYPEPMDQLLKMNPGLSSRFGQSNILTIEDYPPELLQSIFETNCRKDGYRFWGDEEGEEPPLDLALFFRNLYDGRDRANFGNARDAVAIARDVKMQASLRDDEARCITQADFAGYERYFAHHGEDSIETVYAELSRYVGLDFVRELFDNVRLEILDAQDCQRRGIRPDVTPDHYIFAGNPGTGKTTVGKMLGRFYHAMGVLGGAETIFTDASELIGSHVGDSAKRVSEKMQEAIDHNALLYIDEAYQIADTSYSAEIVGAMMTKMTENAADFKMVFGIYQNRVEDFLKLNAGLSRRVRVVHFPDYTPAQLLAIFDRSVEAQGRRITDEARHLVELLLTYRYDTRAEDFGNAGEVKRLVTDMKRMLLRRVGGDENADRYLYTAEDIPPEQLALIQAQLHPRTFDDILQELNEQIGLSDLKTILMQKREEWLFAQKSGGSTDDICPGYYFFVGNPGTGKSTGAKLFAECLHEMGIVKTPNFYACTAKDLIGQYVGETDKKTYALLQKSINGVLFIDEAYSLSYADDPHGGGFKKEALEQIIAFMDIPEHRRKCCMIFAGYEKDMQGLYRSNSGMRSRIEEVRFRDFTAEEMVRIFALFCRKGGYLIGEGVEEAYTPIFARLIGMPYFSNGRTVRTVYEKTLARFRHRVLHTQEEQSGDALRTIEKCDLLSEEECVALA